MYIHCYMSHTICCVFYILPMMLISLPEWCRVRRTRTVCTSWHLVISQLLLADLLHCCLTAEILMRLQKYHAANDHSVQNHGSIYIFCMYNVFTQVLYCGRTVLAVLNYLHFTSIYPLPSTSTSLHFRRLYWFFSFIWQSCYRYQRHCFCCIRLNQWTGCPLDSLKRFIKMSIGDPKRW